MIIVTLDQTVIPWEPNNELSPRPNETFSKGIPSRIKHTEGQQ